MTSEREQVIAWGVEIFDRPVEPLHIFGVELAAQNYAAGYEGGARVVPLYAAPAVHEDTRFLKLLGEIDCRIEHGAQSNGHLEGLRSIYDPRYAARATPEGK